MSCPLIALGFWEKLASRTDEFSKNNFVNDSKIFEQFNIKKLFSTKYH